MTVAVHLFYITVQLPCLRVHFVKTLFACETKVPFAFSVKRRVDPCLSLNKMLTYIYIYIVVYEMLNVEKFKYVIKWQ